MTVDLTGYRNLGEAFAARVAAHPERTALTLYHGSTGVEPESITYGELARRSQVRAEDLSRRLALGERVLIALPTGTDFAEVYLACLSAGLVAVPSPMPGGSASAGERIAAIAADCSPGLTVTTEAAQAEVTAHLRGHGLERLRVEAVRPVGTGQTAVRQAAGRVVDRGADAILQYSSGSTGSPKGVILTHGAVLANVEAVCTYLGLGPQDRFGSWLPLHHDMGLFTQLTAALLCGAPLTLMQPTLFIRRPVEWFRMLDRFRITYTCAPNFAYDLCTRLITDEMTEELDLSALRYACNGAEPIHAPTVEAFVERFARIGLGSLAHSPGYGLAESTAYVTCVPEDARPTVLTVDPLRLEAGERPELRPVSDGAGRQVTGLGRPHAFDLRIVDPRTRGPLSEGRVGEIWLRGESIGRGYWGKPELSARVFDARVADADEGPGWLRTGDLGALVDGELFVTGRLKELLIVHGRNIFPQDVEVEARAAHEALGGQIGAAFVIGSPDERVVLVHEVHPRTPKAELSEVATAVTRRLSRSFGLPMRNIVLVRRGTVRRTTSGKIKRTAMRERFLAGDMKVLHAELEPALRAAPTGPER
ncbi:fatty acyl-AMP ligase [Streptomyces sp. NBC_00576]|uniref:fatty acyl-AMP ligase n=1 Tax=Streptomyces sp. NBC_00576 TaxID=2903665 RepID=UPI002E800871|nr:fatty acyl-AMP ligase [Streptomyces sp. NBC_00576]WUB68667.1 fatty acyl-AMP ligase [Streptomyces sp. NBC_00576]WUB77030.1 fatty acyl-AMP ligase [Streptomyces sp. NBC_00576]